MSIIMIGKIFGNLGIGYLADRFGRRKVIMMSFTMEIICFFGAAFNFNLYFYIFMKFMLGASAVGVVNTQIVHGKISYLVYYLFF